MQKQVGKYCESLHMQNQITIVVSLFVHRSIVTKRKAHNVLSAHEEHTRFKQTCDSAVEANKNSEERIYRCYTS